jgi:hypothetical protein
VIRGLDKRLPCARHRLQDSHSLTVPAKKASPTVLRTVTAGRASTGPAADTRPSSHAIPAIPFKRRAGGVSSAVPIPHPVPVPVPELQRMPAEHVLRRDIADSSWQTMSRGPCRRHQRPLLLDSEVQTETLPRAASVRSHVDSVPGRRFSSGYFLAMSTEARVVSQSMLSAQPGPL